MTSAERGTDTELSRIERAFREMDAAGTDSRAYAEPDLHFHRAILSATGNEFLVAFGATVEAALRMSFELSTLNPGAPRKSLPYHRAVLDEIWARNPDGARAAMHRLRRARPMRGTPSRVDPPRRLGLSNHR